MCVHNFGNFPFSWNGRTDTVILSFPGSFRVLFCKWHSVLDLSRHNEAVWNVFGLLCPAHHHKYVNPAFYVHAKFDGVDQVLIPVPGGKCCRQTLRHSSFIVLAVRVCWQTVWRRSVWYLHIPFVIPLPLWGMPQLMKASLLLTFLISALLTSPVSWSARPRRILLHSSFAWVKIFSSSSFPPSPHPQITFVLFYRQSTVVPPASYPPPLLILELRKAVPAQQIVLLFLFLYSFFLISYLSPFFFRVTTDPHIALALHASRLFGFPVLLTIL